MKNLTTFIVFLLFTTLPCMAQTDNDELPETRAIHLNDSLSVHVKQITQGEYEARKKASEHLRQKPYAAVTDFTEAEKMLKGRIKVLKATEEEEDAGCLPGEIEITFNDGTKRGLGYGAGDVKDCFIAYYPELDVVILLNEVDGDCPIDLNDSDNERHVGNPRQSAASPDNRLRVAGYYPGGASDSDYWFLEKWNEARGKYEFVSDLLERYSDGWFWTDNHTVLFKSNNGGEYYCEMKIIVK